MSNPDPTEADFELAARLRATREQAVSHRMPLGEAAEILAGLRGDSELLDWLGKNTDYACGIADTLVISYGTGDRDIRAALRAAMGKAGR